MRDPFSKAEYMPEPIGHTVASDRFIDRFDPLRATTSALSFAAGVALVGTTFAGPIGGIIGAIAGGASGLYLGGMKSR